MQLAVRSETFDGGHACAVSLHRQHRARFDGLAVDENRTRAALTGVTADIGSGEAECVAQEMDEEQTWLDLSGLPCAVDRERDSVFHADLRGLEGLPRKVELRK